MSAGAFPGTKFDVRKKALPLDAKRLRNLNSDMPNLMSLTEDKPLILIGPEVSVVEKKGIF